MSRTRLYIAEDFPMQLELLRAVFSDHPRFDTTFFTDGLDFYLAVMDAPPDVIVLDIILPTVSGLALCRLLKHDDRFRNIPVLVTSSITDHDITEQSLNAGAEVFLPKPFGPNQLIEQLDSIMSPKTDGVV